MTQPTLTDSTFSTDSLKLATYLLANGLPLKGAGFVQSSKLVNFFFDKSPRIMELELAFQNNAPLGKIGIQDLTTAQDTLWDIVQKKRMEGK